MAGKSTSSTAASEQHTTTHVTPPPITAAAHSGSLEAAAASLRAREWQTLRAAAGLYFSEGTRHWDAAKPKGRDTEYVVCSVYAYGIPVILHLMDEHGRPVRGELRLKQTLVFADQPSKPVPPQFDKKSGRHESPLKCAEATILRDGRAVCEARITASSHSNERRDFKIMCARADPHPSPPVPPAR